MPASVLRLRPLLLCTAIALLLVGCGQSPSGDSAGVEAAPEDALAVTTVPERSPESAAQLMRRANDAFRANRIASPAGDNAVELFLAVRDLDPQHPGLSEVLVELMPLANFALDGAMRTRDLPEADRLLDLITRLNSESAVTRSAREQVAKLKREIEQEAVAARGAADALAAREAVAATAAKPVAATTSDGERKQPPPASLPATATAAPKPANTNAVVSAPPPAAATPIAAAEVSPAASTTSPLTAPRPIAKVAPEYPAQARSRKIEGFVELEFLVTTNGSAEEIRVVRSEPEGLFDRNAVRALMRWKFKPAERDGKREATRTRTTLNFELG